MVVGRRRWAAASPKASGATIIDRSRSSVVRASSTVASRSGFRLVNHQRGTASPVGASAAGRRRPRTRGPRARGAPRARPRRARSRCVDRCTACSPAPPDMCPPWRRNRSRCGRSSAGCGRPVGRLGQDEGDAAAVLDRRGPRAVVVRADDHDLVVGPGQVADDVVRLDRPHVGRHGQAHPHRPGGQQVAQPGAVAARGPTRRGAAAPRRRRARSTGTSRPGSRCSTPTKAAAPASIDGSSTCMISPPNGMTCGSAERAVGVDERDSAVAPRGCCPRWP